MSFYFSPFRFSFSLSLFPSIVLSPSGCFYEADAVLKAFLIAVSVFVGLTIFAMQSKYDFSSWGPVYAEPLIDRR